MIRTFGEHIGKEMELDIKDRSAILNPSGDLKRTEQFLEPLVESLRPKPFVCGRPPSRNEILECLDLDLFLYFGHGSGELYLPAQDVSSLACCASVMLFGCSSGRLKRNGTYKPEGILLAFSDAASPLILANLWDVTDRDIDKLTEALLKDLDLSQRPRKIASMEVVDSLERSRAVCLLKLLNGAAPIIYWNKES